MLDECENHTLKVIATSIMQQLVNSSPLDKMTAISQMTFWNNFFCMKKIIIFIKLSLTFVPKCPIDNNQALF